MRVKYVGDGEGPWDLPSIGVFGVGNGEVVDVPDGTVLGSTWVCEDGTPVPVPAPTGETTETSGDGPRPRRKADKADNKDGE